MLIATIHIVASASDLYQIVDPRSASSFYTALELESGEVYYRDYSSDLHSRKWYTTFFIEENSYASIGFTAEYGYKVAVYDENYNLVLDVGRWSERTEMLPFKSGWYYASFEWDGYSKNPIVLSYSLHENVFCEKENNDTFTNANFLPFDKECLVFVNTRNNREDYFYFETDSISKHTIWIKGYEVANPYLYLYESDRSTYSIISPKYDDKANLYYYSFTPKYEGKYYIKSSAFNDETMFSIVIEKEHIHSYIPSSTTEATCLNGTTITYNCICGLSYTEEVPAKGHVYVETINKATTSANGEKIVKCANCDYTITETINKISSIKLSTTKVTYNGKQRTPSVIVTDSDGEKLKEDVDFTVSYESGRKLPGIYTITVKFKGNYDGKKSLKLTITPKATTGIKATKKTGTSITLSWSKTTGATGYRVYQYSSSEGKYIAKKTTKNLSYKVTGLKKNTSYKFKIKPYTKMEDGSVIWGDSSSAYTAKTTKGYSVDISGTSATLYVGKTKQLKATTTPSGKAITWKSSKKSVATVSSSGKVTAKAPGTATITAVFEYKGETYKDTYKITVKAYIGSDKTKISMKDTEKKKVLIKTDNFIENVSYLIVDGENVVDCTWSAWNGNNIYLTIKPLCAGTAKIKIMDAYDEDNYFYINVTVKSTSKSISDIELAAYATILLDEKLGTTNYTINEYTIATDKDEGVRTVIINYTYKGNRNFAYVRLRNGRATASTSEYYVLYQMNIDGMTDKHLNLNTFTDYDWVVEYAKIDGTLDYKKVKSMYDSKLSEGDYQIVS